MKRKGLVVSLIAKMASILHVSVNIQKQFASRISKIGKLLIVNHLVSFSGKQMFVDLVKINVDLQDIARISGLTRTLQTFN